jgi:hypothetical protein
MASSEAQPHSLLLRTAKLTRDKVLSGNRISSCRYGLGQHLEIALNDRKMNHPKVVDC